MTYPQVVNWRKLLFVSVSVFLSSSLAHAQVEITLRKSFIDSFKNKVTINASFFIDKAHARPNPGSKDGDMHIAGRDSTIGLPIVAEIMNAKDEDEAVNLVHQKEGSGTTVGMKGVWRLWCEHVGEDQQLQRGRLKPFTTTNPNHVFEIHPVLKINNISVIKSLTGIDGYTYKTTDAFSRYASTRCKLIPKTKTVTIETAGVGYNYVEFNIELLETPLFVSDGAFAMCRVLDNDSELVAQKIRMAFAKDSPPYNKLKDMAPGERLHVVGIPRIDLALVSYRIRHASANGEMLSWNLPFEMIIVAILN